MWEKLVSFLQGNQTDAYYEAKLYSFVIISIYESISSNEYIIQMNEIFQEIKENVKRPYSETLTEIISQSLDMYIIHNKFLPQHEQKPYIDLVVTPTANPYMENCQLLDAGKNHEALEHLDEERRKAEIRNGINHPYTLNLYYCYGLCYLKLKDFEEAIVYLKKRKTKICRISIWTLLLDYVSH